MQNKTNLKHTSSLPIHYVGLLLSNFLTRQTFSLLSKVVSESALSHWSDSLNFLMQSKVENMEFNIRKAQYKLNFFSMFNANGIAQSAPEPGDFLTNVKQISSHFNVAFCRPALPHNQILCLHDFNLRSLYFQSLQPLLNWIQLHTPEPHQCGLHFNE